MLICPKCGGTFQCYFQDCQHCPIGPTECPILDNSTAWCDVDKSISNSRRICECKLIEIIESLYVRNQELEEMVNLHKEYACNECPYLDWDDFWRKKEKYEK